MDLNEQDLSAGGKLKSTSTRRRSSKSTGRKSTAKETSESATQATSKESIASSEVSHVRIFPTPDEGQDWPQSEADCFSRPFAWFENCNPEQLSWRTWQRCLLGGWIEFSGRWPRSGMMLGGIAYRLPPLVLRISGTGCLSSQRWPTPIANDAQKRGVPKVGAGLAGAVHRWPTPDANCGNRGASANPAAKKHHTGTQKQTTLNDAAKMWPTPRAFMHKDSTTDRGKSNLGEVVGGQLNPQWVEWLMGFPLGWTDLDA